MNQKEIGQQGKFSIKKKYLHLDHTSLIIYLRVGRQQNKGFDLINIKIYLGIINTYKQLIPLRNIIILK